MTPRQREYVLAHASELGPSDLARGSRLPEKTVRALLREARLATVDAPRQSRLPFLFPQADRPDCAPPSKVDARFAAAVGAVAFLFYLLTCARDLTGADRGDMVTAAKLLGVARPPGYPLWCLLGQAFSWIPVGSAALRVALLSAAAGAATVTFVCLLLMRLSGSRPASAAAALLLAFSLDFWSQSVIAEVYTLNAFFLALALYLSWRWYEDRTNRLLFALAVTLGLSLTHHSTMAPLLVLFFAFVLCVHWSIWREPGLLPLAGLLTALPLLFYLYLPLRAEAHTLMNWGNPRDLDSVLDHILQAQYSAGSTGAPRTAAGLWAQALTLLREAGRQWTPWLGWLALPGLALSLRRNWRFGVLLTGIFTACTAGFIAFLNFDASDREKVTACRLLYIPAWVVASVWIGESLAAGGAILSRFRISRPERLAWAGCALAIVPLLAHYRVNDRSGDRVVRQYAEAILATLPERAMFVPTGDHSSFPLIYIQGIEKRRLDVTIMDKYGYTDPDLLFAMPAALRVGVPRIPPADADQRFQDWLLSTTDRPVYFTNKRSLAGFPGCRLVQEGILYRLVRSGEKYVPRTDLFSKYDLSALDRRPHDFTADVIDSEFHLARGADRAAHGDLQGARADFERSAGATQGIKQGFNNLGSAAAEAGLLKEAVGYLERALALDPEYPTALRNLVRACISLKRWNDAKAAINRMLAVNPKDIGARFQLVELYRAQGNGRLAIFEIEKIAKDEPKNVSLLVAAGDLSLEEGDSLGALTYFQRALSLEPDRMDLLQKVQDLLMAGSRSTSSLDPFGTAPRPPVPGIPRPPNPLNDLFGGGFQSDPMDPFRKRR